MAKKDLDAKMKELQKDINDKYARGLVDSFNQLVTMQVDNIVSSWQEGYKAFLEKHKDKPFPSGEDWDWEAGVKAVWQEIQDEVSKLTGHLIVEEGSDYFVFSQKENEKRTFDLIKGYSIKFIQGNLKDYKLTGAKEEAELAGAPASDIAKFAGKSDIGVIKTQQVRAHTGKTTVGAARLVLTLKWMSKTRYFKQFLKSKSAKTLEDKYGDILYTFESSGTKTRGLKLKIQEDIRLEIVADSKNWSGSATNDWGGKNGIKKNLDKYLLEWIKSENPEDWKGSDSIVENALNAVEYEMYSKLSNKGKRRTTGPKPKNSSRKKTTVQNKAKGKSKKTAGTAPRTNLKGKAKASTKTRTDNTPITLFALLNARISKQVAGNMGDPRLNYRTGRFASSVRVTDVTKTPKGFLSVGYTYEKDPYQVFESSSGTRFSSVDRDPRAIIDFSIREIAASLVESRLYTRRQ